MKIATLAVIATALTIGLASPAIARPDGHTKTSVKAGHHKAKKHTKKAAKKSVKHTKKHSAKKHSSK